MNKKVILISLLVIVGAISISGCLGPNEDETYNKEMTAVYQDFIELNKTMNNLSSNDEGDINTVMNEIDYATNLFDNDTQKLKQINGSISNSTRKEYVGLWINYLEICKKGYIELKNAINVVKDLNNTNPEEALDKLGKTQEVISKCANETESIEKEIKDYEKKYPYVLINGTTSLIIWNTTSDEINY